MESKTLYTDGTNIYDTQPTATIGSFLSGENHVLIGIAVGAILYLIAYGYERFDIAAIIFFVLITGIAVDFYLNSYYH